MHVIFSYSLIEELKNISDLIFHNKEYKDLRWSVVYPSLKGIIDSKHTQNIAIKEYTNIWNDIEPKFNKAVENSSLTPLKANVICFLHTFGCEGWFNTDKNQIHVRTVESSKENTIDSIIHELLHLITYQPKMSYQYKEDLVEKYMKLPAFQELLLNI